MSIIRRCLAYQDARLLFLVIFSLFIGLTWSRMIVLIEAEFLVCFSDIFKYKQDIKSMPKIRSNNNYIHKEVLHEKNSYSC